MLMFKNDSLFDIILRNFEFTVTKTSYTLSKRVFDTIKDQRKKAAIVDDVMNGTARFRSSIENLSKDIMSGRFAEVDLITLRVSSMYSSFLHDLVSQLYSRFHEESDEKFDRALKKFASALNAINIQEFFDLDTANRIERLKKFKIDNRLAEWSDLLHVYLWKEGYLKKDISRYLREEVLTERFLSNPNLTTKQIVEFAQERVNEDFFHQTIAAEMKDVSDRAFVDNSDLDELQGSIHGVVERTSRRMYSYVEKETINILDDSSVITRNR